MSTRCRRLVVVATLFSVAASAITTSPSRADLMWEHTATLRSSRSPKALAKIKMYNTWTPQRYRALFKYSLLPPSDSAIKELGASLGNKLPPGLFGEIGLVQLLDTDRVLAYESQSKSYVTQPRLALLKRLQFNPWKNLDPKLASEEIPELTPVQRERLIAEISAVYAPLRQQVERTYFRSLPNTRNFNGIEGRGYRLTQLINEGGSKKNQSWMRFSSEWWVAAPLKGDSDADQFYAQARADRKSIGGFTTSMWLNEMIALGQIPVDPVLRRALNAIRASSDSNFKAFHGTPLQYSIRIVPPALQRAQTGDILFEMNLTKRSTSALPSSVFEAPRNYKVVPTDETLKTIDPFFDGSAWKKMMDEILK